MPHRQLGFSTQKTVIVAGFIVLMAMSLGSLWLIRESVAARDDVTQSLSILNLLANARADLRRAESGQRGYLLTGEAHYLDDYQAIRTRLLPPLDEVAELTVLDAEQNARIKELRDIVEEKLAELWRTVELRQAGRADEAYRIVASDVGLALMNHIVELVGVATAREQQELNRRLRQSNQIEIALFAVNVVGGLIIVSLAGLWILLFRRSARELIAAQAALEAANRDLETRIAERTADLREANEEIQRFAYVVSHDLRAPLVNIMGFTGELEALRDDVLARAASGAIAPAADGTTAASEGEALRRDFDEALRFIKSSISKMDRLINAVLKLSRAGRQEFTAREVDLGQLVGTLTADFAHRAQQSETEFSVGPLPRIVSDRLVLEQVISNLLDNALKYLRNGVPGRVRFSARDAGASIELSIADNGRGIAEVDRERIFELFRRAGVQDQPGEGIGLAHVRTLVRRIGGTIRLESRVNQGSTFTLTLPKKWAP